MNKKLLKKIVGLFVLTILITICVRTYYVIVENEKVNKRIQSIPPISFTKLHGGSVDYHKGRIVVYYFSPDCEYCQYMTRNLVKSCNYNKATKFIMVTSAAGTSTKEFIDLYRIADCPSITVYTDSTFSFYSVFGESTVPSFFVYENSVLVKKWVGETKIENLLGN